MYVLIIPNSPPNSCHSCGTKENVTDCKGCGTVYYCSRKCQMRDWTEHKKFCKWEEKKLGNARREKCLSLINEECVFQFLMVQKLLDAKGVLFVKEGSDAVPHYVPLPTQFGYVEVLAKVLNIPIPIDKEGHKKLSKTALLKPNKIPVVYEMLSGERKVYAYTPDHFLETKHQVNQMPDELVRRIFNGATGIPEKVLLAEQLLIGVAGLEGCLFKN